MSLNVYVCLSNKGTRDIISTQTNEGEKTRILESGVSIYASGHKWCTVNLSCLDTVKLCVLNVPNNISSGIDDI